jgi:hypothetical protein
LATTRAPKLGGVYIRVDSIEAALKNGSLQTMPPKDVGYPTLKHRTFRFDKGLLQSGRFAERQKNSQTKNGVRRLAPRLHPE